MLKKWNPASNYSVFVPIRGEQWTKITTSERMLTKRLYFYFCSTYRFCTIIPVFRYVFNIEWSNFRLFTFPHSLLLWRILFFRPSVCVEQYLWNQKAIVASFPIILLPFRTFQLQLSRPSLRLLSVCLPLIRAIRCAAKSVICPWLAGQCQYIFCSISINRIYLFFRLRVVHVCKP